MHIQLWSKNEKKNICFTTVASTPAAAVAWRLYKNGPEEPTVECPAKGGLLLDWHKPVRGPRAGNQHTHFSLLDLRTAASTVDIWTKIYRSDFMSHSLRQYVTLTLTEDLNARKEY
jgi:hypothetical protein